jgi:hypothetical protein
MKPKILCLLALAFASPAWSASHGNTHDNHGAMVSQTAHDAKANGQAVGPAVRDVARSNSQGPSHASANGIAHANSHSVLAGATSTKQTGKGHAKKAKTHGNH